MSTVTPNLGLFKYDTTIDANVAFNINTALNQNWDIIDEKVGNIDDKITNCITKIPQDIKLELNNGTLTLKAGSKVYVPNGFEKDGTTRKFDEEIVPTDCNYTYGFNDTRMLFVQSSSHSEVDGFPVVQCYSGDIAPNGTTYMYWYDTANNTIKRTTDGGSTWDSNNYSLPICIITGGTNVVNSLNQVFNGFGYIGGCVFTLHGLKGLIPNGRNEDGTLNNIEVEAQNVSIMDYHYSGDAIYGGLSVYGDVTLNGERAYDSKENYLYDGANIVRVVEVCKGVWVNGKITSFESYLPTHLVDRKDLTEVQCVIETYYSGTSWYRIWSDGWCEQGGRAELNETSTTTITLLKPFTNTNYSVSAVSITASTVSDTEVGLQCTPVSINQISLTAHYLNPNNQMACWQAMGYII